MATDFHIRKIQAEHSATVVRNTGWRRRVGDASQCAYLPVGPSRTTFWIEVRGQTPQVSIAMKVTEVLETVYQVPLPWLVQLDRVAMRNEARLWSEVIGREHFRLPNWETQGRRRPTYQTKRVARRRHKLRGEQLPLFSGKGWTRRRRPCGTEVGDLLEQQFPSRPSAAWQSDRVTSPTPRRVLMIGLGTIARTHLAVLETRADVRVVAGVDSRASDQPFPVFHSLAGALAAAVAPDLVVVATPTDTHPAIVREVLTNTDALVLSEKPLARDLAGIRELEAAEPDVADRVKVAHHFAFSPEVEWARAVALAHPGWGRPTRVLSVFNDAYGHFSAERLASYVSTWVDSGPNQLSLLGAFADGWRLIQHDDHRHRSITTLEHDGGTSVLTSNWLAADSSKQTTVEYGDGAMQLRMDHTSMTGLVVEDGRVVEHLGYTGTASRKEAHYLGLYDALFGDPADPRLSVPLALEIARLLEAGEQA